MKKVNWEELTHVEKMEHLFQRIAEWSLAIDFAITVVTLASVNMNVSNVQAILNWALSAVLIISVIIFVTIRVMIHYERILDAFAELGLGGRRRRKRG